MKRKMIALLLSALVVPGLGQLYLGRKLVGGVIMAIVNLLLLLALFVLLRGLSPVIANQLAGGAISITASDVIQALEGVSGFGRWVLAAFCAVWLCAVIDILRQPGDR